MTDARYGPVVRRARVSSRLLSPKNLELLETIAEHEPESIREVPTLVDREYKQVHRNLSGPDESVGTATP